MGKVSNNIKLRYLENTNDASVCNLYTFLNKKFSKTHRKIIVLTEDHLSGDSLFLPSLHRDPLTIDKIISVASLYPEFEFTVIHNCLNIPDTVSNITFICQGPECMINLLNNYLYAIPQAEKSFSESYFWISLNGNRRVHRYLTSMFLLGSNVEDYGLLRFDPTEILTHSNWESYLWWWQYNERPEILDIEQFYPIFKKGFYKIKNSHGFESIIYTSTSTP